MSNVADSIVRLFLDSSHFDNIEFTVICMVSLLRIAIDELLLSYSKLTSSPPAYFQ